MKKVLMLSAVLGMFFSVLHAQKVDYGLKTGDQVTIDGTSYTALRNLISNGGFDDSSLTGWARGNNYNSTARVNYYIYWYDYDGVNNSPYIYQSSCSPTSSYAIAKHWALDTGKKYYLSFWTRGIYEESYSPVFSLTNLESTGAAQNEYGDGCKTILGRSSSDTTDNVYENANVSEDGSWVRTSLVFDSEDFMWLQFRLSDNYSDIQFDEFFLCELKKTSDVTMRDTLTIPELRNPSFDNGSNYWSFNWYSGYDYGTRNNEDNNFVYWYNGNYSIGNSFDIYQDLTDVPNGLYLLQAQAMQRNASVDEVRTNINEEPSTKIYINEYSQSIKNDYADAQDENIYGDYYTITPEGKYIPNSSNSWTPIAVAFNNGLYDNAVFGRVTNNSLRIGIRNSNQQWYWSCVAADNFRLSFVDEAELKYYRDSIATWATQLQAAAMSSSMKTELQKRITTLNGTTIYEDMADAFIAVAEYGKVALVNIKAYSELAASADALKNRLAEGTFMNSTSVAEGDSLMNVFNTAYVGGTLSTEEARALKAVIDEQTVRLNYLHLDIAVTTPGAMGDSILAKVENFADVQSIRLSGRLNADDIATLKDRLTSLVEIDMSKLDWAAIPSSQFYQKTGLRRVVLPDNLKSIGSEAFYGCQNITNITLPAALQSIGSYAFYNCYALASVNFPEGLTSIGSYAFYSNTSGYYDEQGYYREKGGALKEVSLPSTLQTLGEYSFGYQTSLEKVVIADGLTAIGNNAFCYCTSLTELLLPQTLQTINYYAFAYCSSLKKLEIPEGVTTINERAFRNCSTLEEVILPSTLLNVYYYPFTNCQNLTKMTCKAIVPPYANNNIMGGSESQCALTVPSLSVNVYKQSSYWDRFNIVGENMMPDNITITSDYKLNWPDSLNIEYKPNVYITSDDNQSRYGSLTVNGNSTLSASQFTMKYDPNTARNTQYNYNTGNYEYKRDAYASLVNNANVRADNVTLEVWTRANVWDFIAVPFDVKVSDIRLAYEGTPFVIRKYDGQKRAEGLTSETWVNMTADSTLQAGQGYIWQSASTDANRSYNGFFLDALQTVNKNNMFVNKDLEVDLAYYESEFEHNRSWNFIGNPYPCFYDTRAMLTSAPITIWNGYNSVYEAYSPADDSYILNPGQAFFVQRPVNEDKITFMKEGRQTNLTVRDIDYNTNRAASSVERSVFNVTLTGNEMGDRTRFVINSSAKMDYESGRDASKFMSLEGKSAQLYTLQNDVRFAINERPLGEGIVELGIQLGAEGTYILALNTKVNNEVYLIDRLTGTEIRIDGTEGYTFNADKGTIEGRFAIRLGNGETTGIKAVEGTTSTSTEYYDLQGRRISQPQKGVYINNGKKVVVK